MNVLLLFVEKDAPCDGCLWLIIEVYDKSQKTYKVNHHNKVSENSVVYHIVRATLSD